MRTNIEINDELMAEAMKLSNKITKKQLVENALELYIDMMKRKGMLDLFGKVDWDGDLNQMRLNEGEKLGI
ncbi:antitoxin of type II TA system, VapB [Spirosomataceae bacterium TFI 002]|nr:antitoxin of type II TA system, VapB [Spirosomataceae bacterium TFI 002]